MRRRSGGFGLHSVTDRLSPVTGRLSLLAPRRSAVMSFPPPPGEAVARRPPQRHRDERHSPRRGLGPRRCDILGGDQHDEEVPVPWPVCDCTRALESVYTIEKCTRPYGPCPLESKKGCLRVERHVQFQPGSLRAGESGALRLAAPFCCQPSETERSSCGRAAGRGCGVWILWIRVWVGSIRGWARPG